MKILLLAFEQGTKPHVNIDEGTGAITVVGTLAKALQADATIEEFNEIVERTQI